MYRTIFSIDLDTNKIKKDLVEQGKPPNHYTIFYSKINSYLTNRGFEKLSGSVYQAPKDMTQKEFDKAMVSLFIKYPELKKYANSIIETKVGKEYNILESVKKGEEIKTNIEQIPSLLRKRSIDFDLDTNLIKEEYSKKGIPVDQYSREHNKILKYMLDNGFTHSQYSKYISYPMPQKHFDKIISDMFRQYPELRNYLKSGHISFIIGQEDVIKKVEKIQKISDMINKMNPTKNKTEEIAQQKTIINHKIDANKLAEQIFNDTFDLTSFKKEVCLLQNIEKDTTTYMQSKMEQRA